MKSPDEKLFLLYPPRSKEQSLWGVGVTFQLTEEQQQELRTPQFSDPGTCLSKKAVGSRLSSHSFATGRKKTKGHPRLI